MEEYYSKCINLKLKCDIVDSLPNATEEDFGSHLVRAVLEVNAFVSTLTVRSSFLVVRVGTKSDSRNNFGGL
ncbi:hypothetical protein INT46_009660 [Mucor plumbeus]|uniref:Uncharacterized protein n=1 Tax=Mucor plumbeus TaxID=97098 RepID=A0A8H7RLR4_9FUNG|nr:hypothetical protein INT46_009660 [Mucor plumbeus]